MNFDKSSKTEHWMSLLMIQPVGVDIFFRKRMSSDVFFHLC